MSGFIAMHRDAFAHPILKDAERFRAWFWLVANAAWKPTRHDARGHTIEVQRGQICAGRDHLAKAWGWSSSAVERFLTRLETEQMIERQSGQIKTVITICNYEKYQDLNGETEHMSGQSTGQKPDRNRTTKEQGNQETIEEEAKASPSGKRAVKPNFFVRPEWADPQHWADFMENRRRKKLPNSLSAFRGVMADIAKFTCDYWPPGKLLERAAMKGWGSIVMTDEMKAEIYGHGSQANRNGGSNVSAGQRGGKFDGFASALDEGIHASRAESSARQARQSDDEGAPKLLSFRNAS